MEEANHPPTIITIDEFNTIKEALKWRCPVGNDPIFCPEGCIEKPVPCFEEITINNHSVYRCPHHRNWIEVFESWPDEPKDNDSLNEKHLNQMADYFKKVGEYYERWNQTWDDFQEQCTHCEEYDMWLHNSTYEAECRSYRNAVWKTYLLNTGKAELWQSGIR